MLAWCSEQQSCRTLFDEEDKVGFFCEVIYDFTKKNRRIGRDCAKGPVEQSRPFKKASSQNSAVAPASYYAGGLDVRLEDIDCLFLRSPGQVDETQKSESPLFC